MEERFEKQEKNQRKNYGIIKNSEISGDDIKGVENFIRGKLSLNTKVTEAYESKEDIILAKIESWEQKRRVMENKQKLRGTNKTSKRKTKSTKKDSQRRERERKIKGTRQEANDGEEADEVEKQSNRGELPDLTRTGAARPQNN
ncbi:hypothetical protein ILUMI_18468 [Ignelater luminosus]|uniref:Uncharacterized protein n=1 Tax=Ignelater luminosus TaxID=2038154 RepID=A0A8K0CI71_IGNLU|nr:hypothetical protein ILUMI_18468 [Ignelater luminosus]